jgi:hypothetical protein
LHWPLIMNTLRIKLKKVFLLLAGLLLIPEVVFAQTTVSTGTRILQVIAIVGVFAALVGLVYGVVRLRNANETNDILLGERSRRIASISGVLFAIMLILTVVSFLIIGGPPEQQQIADQGGIQTGGGQALQTRDSLILSEAIPFGEISIRNAQIQLLFNQSVDKNAIDQHVRVLKQGDANPISGQWEVDGSFAAFSPQQTCPTPDQGMACFDASAIYEVHISLALSSQDGDSFRCSLETTAQNCVFTFTTGENIDKTKPTVSITLPYDETGAPFDSSVLLEALGKDETGVATIHFFADQRRVSVASVASGEVAREFRGATSWDTSGLIEDTTYELTAKVLDLAGLSTTSDPISVDILSLQCFDNVQNQEEEAIDCGGATCRACEGSICSSNADCASGLCFQESCREFPLIQEVIDPDGAPGNYITIRGQNFGEEPGQLIFLGQGGDEDDVIGLPPACELYWTDKQVVIQIPENVQNGPFRLVTADALFDVTDDSKGSFIEFFPSDDIRPGICPPDPTTQVIGELIQVVGTNLGDEPGLVLFGQFKSEEFELWTNNAIAEIAVPQVEPGLTALRIEQEEKSNPVFFDIQPSPILPRIATLTPNRGPIGQMITVLGENFDSSFSGDLIDVQTGEVTPIDLRIPDQCSLGQTSKQRAIRIPRVQPGSYQAVIRTDAGESNAVGLRVTEGERIPGLCAVVPDNGPAGIDVTFYGENFGDAEGGIRFNPRIDDTLINGWSSKEIKAVVPDSVQTGPTQLFQPDGTLSNSFEFTVGQCSPDTCQEGFECCGSGACMKSGSCVDSVAFCSYSWVFSTGDDLNGPPRVIEEPTCVNTTQSPSAYINTQDACLNAVISARFTHDMEDQSLRSENMTVRRCNTGGAFDPGACTSTVTIRRVDIINSNQPGEGFLAVPSGQLNPDTWYQIELSTGFTATNGQTLQTPYTWSYKTQVGDSQCEPDHVEVTPSAATLGQIGESQRFSGVPTALNCNILDPESYQWNWLSGDTGKARLFSSSSPRADATALAPTPPGPPVDIIGAIPEFGKEDVGKLTINLSPPRILTKFPDCDEACPNAAIGATFDQPMQEESLLAPNNVQMFRCADSTCNRAGLQAFGVRALKYNVTDSFFFFLPQSDLLETSAHYRVVFSGNMRSTSNLGLADLNYDNNNDGVIDSYSWQFKVKEEGEVCELDHVDIIPERVVSGIIGEEYDYFSFPVSKPDACSETGQLLNPESFGWDWASRNTKIADVSQDDTVLPEGFIDPYQLGESKGEGQTTITAKAQGSTGEGDFIVVCGYETDTDCPAPAQPNTHGVSEDSCCYVRPSIISVNPDAGSPDVCTTAITEVHFDQIMDETSVIRNTVLEVNNGANPCISVAEPVEETEEITVWTRTKSLASKFIDWLIPGAIAQSENWCASPATVTVSTRDGSTVARVTPTVPMREETQHRVRIIGDETISDGLVQGVTNKAGVAMFGQETSQFTTSDRECSVDLIEVIIDPPGEAGRDDAFFCGGRDDCPDDTAEGASGNQHTYEALARDITGYLVPAEYAWDITQGDNLIDLNANEGEKIEVTTGSENGLADVTVFAEAIVPSTGSASATIDVSVFICENPWPGLSEFPYINDAYGYFTFYCRDFGQPGFDDDLPPLRDPLIGDNIGGFLQDSIFVVE